ncbi:MAG: hypothetical protein JWN25_775 [Verrucomicrobiales bacterium]|nr:hypothetical protein [Verrucomicrobiales bacterium]
MATLGKRNLLNIIKAAPPGLYLDGGDLGEILLPGPLIPKDVAPKDKLDVFIYLDSEDRLVATPEKPLAMVGDFALLKVKATNRQMGAFLDWGLSKDLLLPFREQEFPVRLGQSVVAYVYLDKASNRIVASTRLKKFLDREPPGYKDQEAVNLLIVSKTPLGYNAIIENAHRGLLYHDKLAGPLEPGQRMKGYIRKIREEGKIDLSLDKAGYRRVASLKDQVVQAMEKQGGKLAMDDSSTPEEIRNRFSVSKNAFKQALGSLYKARRIRFTNPGVELLDNSTWTPGEKK